jgi:hypothetical protein
LQEGRDVRPAIASFAGKKMIYWFSSYSWSLPEKIVFALLLTPKLLQETELSNK